MNQNIEVVIPAANRLLSFAATTTDGGTGSASNPYVTYTSTLTLSLQLTGTGHIVITDAAGNILYAADKTSPTLETLNPVISLPSGVMDYVLTATYSDLADPEIIYTASTINISYRATTILPTPPSVPNTGYLYFADRAFLASDFIIIISLVSIISIVTTLVIRHKKPQKTAHAKR
jgi:hypothetical protein